MCWLPFKITCLSLVSQRLFLNSHLIVIGHHSILPSPILLIGYSKVRLTKNGPRGSTAGKVPILYEIT